MNKRIVSLILAVVAVFSVVAMSSCNKTPAEPETTTVAEAPDVGYAVEGKLSACFDVDMKPYSYGLEINGSDIKYGAAGFSVDIVCSAARNNGIKASLSNIEDEKMALAFAKKNCDVCIMRAETAEISNFKDDYKFVDEKYPSVVYVFRSKKVYEDFAKAYAAMEKDGTIAEYAKKAGIKSK